MTAAVAIVSVAAVIGYATNWVAIKMLFWPRKEFRVFGARLPLTPGVFVKRKEDFALSVGSMVESEFVDGDEVVAAYFRAQDRGQVAEFIDSIGGLFRVGWNIYVTRITRDQFCRDLKSVVARVSKSGVVSEVVGSKIRSMDVARVEDLVMRVVEKELLAVTWFGAVMGAVIGCVQVLMSRALS